MIWVGDDALSDWAHRLAGRLLIVAFTFSAKIGVDLKDSVTHGNCAVWALGVTHITVNALIRDQQRHGYLPVGLRVS